MHFPCKSDFHGGDGFERSEDPLSSALLHASRRIASAHVVLKDEGLDVRRAHQGDLPFSDFAEIPSGNTTVERPLLVLPGLESVTAPNCVVFQ